MLLNNYFNGIGRRKRGLGTIVGVATLDRTACRGRKRTDVRTEGSRRAGGFPLSASENCALATSTVQINNYSTHKKKVYKLSEY